MSDNLKVYININVYVMVFFEGLKLWIRFYTLRDKVVLYVLMDYFNDANHYYCIYGGG
jgi:hypothetical protein